MRNGFLQSHEKNSAWWYPLVHNMEEGNWGQSGTDFHETKDKNHFSLMVHTSACLSRTMHVEMFPVKPSGAVNVSSLNRDCIFFSPKSLIWLNHFVWTSHRCTSVWYLSWVVMASVFVSYSCLSQCKSICVRLRWLKQLEVAQCTF